MSLFLRSAALSDVGRVRRDNQDSGYAGQHLLVVADGVGGAARGDIASSVTVEAIRKLDVPPGNDGLSTLAATIHLAHDRLAEIAESHPDLDGTSTTVTAAIFDGTQLLMGHVGDSRAYLLRDGALQQLTADHTLVQSLVDEGRITEEEARVHPHRNLILRAVDGVHEPEPDLFGVPVQAGDRLLFCSDGCAGVLDDAALTAGLAGEPLDDVAARLVTASLDAGSSDNVTVIVADVVEGTSPATHALVVGAAATSPHLQIVSDRTGNLTDSDVAQLSAEPFDPEAIRYAPQPPPSRGWIGRLLVVAVLLGLLGGAVWAAYEYSQTRYFVTSDDGRVTIYRGVDFSVPGLELNRVVKRTPYSLEAMGAFSDEVLDGKDVDSLAIAEQFILRAVCSGADSSSAAGPLGPLAGLGLRPVADPPRGMNPLFPPLSPYPRLIGAPPPPDCSEVP